MTAILGSKAKLGIKATGTWGTAAAASTGDLADGSQLAHTEGADVLRVPPVGAGEIAQTATDRGNITPTVGLSGPAIKFNDPAWVAAHTVFGGTSISNHATGAYSHSIYVAANLTKFYTTAYQIDGSEAMEYPSAVGTKFTLNFQTPPNYVAFSVDGLANKQELASVVNTFSTLNAITAGSTTRAIFDLSDSFWINAQAGGALSGSDIRNIVSAVVEYERPQEHPREAKGAAGHGQPVATGEFPFSAKITVTFKTTVDVSDFTAAQAGTEYKALLKVTGPTITGTDKNFIQCYFPRLKIVSSPKSDLAVAGFNPCVVVFESIVATANPTGMGDRYPYIVVGSNRATALNV